MRVTLLHITLLIFLFSCTGSINHSKYNPIPTTLKGNWYTDFQNGEGIYWQDSLTSYGEIYLTDSLHRSLGESLGLMPTSFYQIRNDSFLICYYNDNLNCPEPVGYKILSSRGDTVWFTASPGNKSGRTKTYMVKLPDDEKGFFDYEWTKKNSDSLSEVLDNDFDRRRWKFYSIRAHDMRGYDSALKAGYWNTKN